MLKLPQLDCRLLMLAVITLILLGCSVAEEKRQLYLNSKSIAPLKIPASLATPTGNEVLALPYLGALEGELERFDSSPPVDLPEVAGSSEVAE